MTAIKEKAVIKGSGFNPQGGGFAELIINGHVYPADLVAAAVRHYELPVADMTDVHRLKAYIWKRKSTEEWVLELTGAINGTWFSTRHTQPLHIAPEDVPGLPTLYMEPAAEEANSREMIADLVELVQQQDALLHNLGDFIRENDEKSAKLVEQVRDVLSMNRTGGHYKLASYLNQIEELDVAAAKAVADAADKYNGSQENETAFEQVDLLEAFYELGSASPNDDAVGIVKADAGDCCGCGCSAHATAEDGGSDAELEKSDERPLAAMFNDDLEKELLEHISDDDDAPIIRHDDNVRVLRLNSVPVIARDLSNDKPVEDMAKLLPPESLGIFDRMSANEQQSWLDYVNSERLAYKDKYGIDPKSINGWLPRKPVGDWLLEYRGEFSPE